VNSIRANPMGQPTGDKAVPSAVVRTSCWACGSVLEKEVPRRNLRHRHLRWSCDDCEVSWSGPGEVA
jgi:hypothetical protein